MDQLIRTETPEINPSLYGELIIDKRGRAYNGVKIASSINGVWRTGPVYVKYETRSSTDIIHQNKFKMDKRNIS